MLTTRILTIVRIAWYFFKSLKNSVTSSELLSETCLLVNSENAKFNISSLFQPIWISLNSPMRASSYFLLNNIEIMLYHNIFVFLTCHPPPYMLTILPELPSPQRLAWSLSCTAWESLKWGTTLLQQHSQPEKIKPFQYDICIHGYLLCINVMISWYVKMKSLTFIMLFNRL